MAGAARASDRKVRIIMVMVGRESAVCCELELVTAVDARDATSIDVIPRSDRDEGSLEQPCGQSGHEGRTQDPSLTLGMTTELTLGMTTVASRGCHPAATSSSSQQT